MSSFTERIYAQTVFYPTLWWNMLLGRVIRIRNWWDPVCDDVFLGAYPFAKDVGPLSELGVGAVVNTCEEYAGPVSEYKRFGILQCRIPTTDFTHPKLEDIEKAVDFMESEIANGNKVYVHCKAGRARSATVVACWLIKSKRVTATQAQQLMQTSRAHINPEIYLRPVVQEFERKHLTTTTVD